MTATTSTAGTQEGRWAIRLPTLQIVLLCSTVGLFARLLYWRFVTPNWTPNSDADQYLQIARNLANGDGYSLIFPQLELHATAFRPPAYPTLLALTQYAFGQEVLWPARLLSVVLGIAVVVLTVLLVRRWSTPLGALTAGLTVALYPPLIANDTVTLTEPLALTLLLAVLLFLDQHRPIPAGLASGLLMLTRPNAYLLVAIVAIAFWRWVGWRRAVAFLLICLLVVVPWAIRNQMAIGSFRLTTSEGFNLAAIYSPESQRVGGFVDPVFSDAYADDEELKLSQFDEAKWNSRLTELGLESLRENPGYLLEVVQRNLYAYFELTPGRNAGPERLDGRNETFRKATLPLFYLVTILGMVGLLGRWRDSRIWPAVAIVVSMASLSFLLVAPPRLRAPFDLLMCIGLGLLIERLAASRRVTTTDGEEPNIGGDHDDSPGSEQVRLG